MRFSIVLAFAGCALAGVPAKRDLPIVPMLDGRIVGGSSVNIADYPYQLSLQYFGSHICGASIVSAFWAVTAAHCVSGSSSSFFTIRAGSSIRGSGGSVHSVSSIIAHSSYNSRTIDYDIAVIRVSSAFSLGSFGVSAISLPSSGSTPSAGATAVVSGWGTLSSGASTLPTQLQAVQVPIVSRSSCRRSYGTNSITDRMLCAGFTAGGKDACQGDSGGPLVVNGVLVGVVSWGYGCAIAEYPGVYADVGNLRSWIETFPNSSDTGSIEHRIFQGYKASIYDFPYLLSLHYKGRQLCGAAIIGEHYALTAAHCVAAFEEDSFQFRSGSSFKSSGGKMHAINLKDIYAHERFGRKGNDIALIYVDEPLLSNDSIAKAVILPNSSYVPPIGVNAIAVGWGRCGSCPLYSPEQFNAVELPLIPQSRCRLFYPKLTESMICAGYEHNQKGTSQGDSGGPLVVNGVLIGVVSWGGFPFPMAENPDVYASVVALSDWVRSKMAQIESERKEVNV
ncbi:hypothetical protein Trydic_g21329 [Trypoxylus dichotomus]